MMGCCALGTCTFADCYLCGTVAKLPQQTMLVDRAAKYAVPDASLKKDAKHPMFTKRSRKALEAPPLRARV